MGNTEDVLIEQFSHNRFDEGGGITTCLLLDENHVQVAVGYAICSRKDSYNKRLGRIISSGRARKALAAGIHIVTRSGVQEYTSEVIK